MGIYFQRINVFCFISYLTLYSEKEVIQTVSNHFNLE